MSRILRDEAVETSRDSMHLSDEHFAGLLFGSASSEVRAHLEECAQCALEAERVGTAIGSFESDSRLWAERHAATTPVVYPARQPIPAWLQVPTAWAVAAVAMVIATTVGLPRMGYRSAPAASNAAMVSTASVRAEVPAATIKSDNELLSAIDGKLSAGDTPSAQFYGLQGEELGVQGSTSHEVAD